MSQNRCNGIQDMVQLIRHLRSEDGCPWDRKQTPRSLSIYLIEEVYELVDAILAGDPDAVCEELGDALFQILFVAVLYDEQSQFSLDRAIESNLKKMIRRHPHVFGRDRADSADQVKEQWRKIKQAEQRQQQSASVLDSVPAGMPALMRAYRISERAAAIGFDWENAKQAMQTARDEWSEFESELPAAPPVPTEARHRAEMEFGDILFTLVNVARLTGIHPENALIRSVQKFETRFKFMERQAEKKKTSLEKLPREQLEDMWQHAKVHTDND